ncbi:MULTISPECIES: hypothetical protein [Chryseobacterium]|uniref:Uncharacterized protein n=1 Tax=Chryseobacterium geocarposphaerae TaxID=1416776 RepID=A0ABU1LIH8_9FLAO|nr:MULTISPECIES: hypothetical protein [Chryseobacterium]MDR6406536.1 hypothetical protein [Chryseobacterium geocarposphaerae]MDR6699965.1 hypothetical protein [Chryseobacterium ginsenosidimutans]
MNNKIKIALGLIAGGALIYLVRKIKNRENKSETFTGEDGNTYKKDEMYFTADGKVYKNGKLLHFKTPEINEDVTPKLSVKQEKIPKNYDAQPKNVEYHQRGVRHH